MTRIIDKRELTNPDEYTAVPNDLIDKYNHLFSVGKNKEHYEAVMDLIQQTFKEGLRIGRNESPLFAIIPMAIMENKSLSANAKLLYGEIIALSKKSGLCYATNEHLGNVLGLKRESIPKLLKELSGNGFIIIDIQRNKKGTYRNITVSFFNDGGYGNIARGGMADQRGQKRNRQIRNIKKDIAKNSFREESQVFSFDQWLGGVIANKQPHIALIGRYLKYKNAQLASKKVANDEIKRWVKDARYLADFSEERIQKTIKKVESKYPDMWNLSTVRKEIAYG